MIIEENFVSDRGRRRRRSVRVELDEVRRSLDFPTAEDVSVWRQIRTELQRRVGESTFDIWLDPIELIAVDSQRQLMLAAPARTAGWTSKRFGRLLAASASEFGREVRFATDFERHAFDAHALGDSVPSINPKEAAG